MDEKPDDTPAETPADEARAESGMLQSIRAVRLEKLDTLRSLGLDPYPSEVIGKTMATAALALDDGASATLAGRIMTLRVMGNAAFAHLHDESGDVQIMLSKRELDAEATGTDYKSLTRLLDIGDIVRVDGEMMTTRTGEKTLGVRKLQFLAKSLRPLPDKHAGLSDPDALLRKRYLDILLNREVHEMVYQRARFWRATRRFLEDHDFTEVHTPVLEHTTGGADARPFVAYHNFLGTNVALRISMGELWQKRLLVGGFERVFEFGRQFRNESQSREHANDYEQMEFYCAYANHEWGMQFVEELFRHVMQETFGTLQFTLHRLDRTYEVDLSKEWVRYDFRDTIREATGVDIDTATDEELLAAASADGELDAAPNRARLVDQLWKQVRRTIAGPGFLVNEPIALSPLAKRSRNNPEIAERFHVLIAGSELGNGYSELNDPVDQAERFAEQQRMRDSGDLEAQESDDEFVEALEYGMPPAIGFGMSERVFSTFLDKTLRESQIFPLLKQL